MVGAEADVAVGPEREQRDVAHTQLVGCADVDAADPLGTLVAGRERHHRVEAG